MARRHEARSEIGTAAAAVISVALIEDNRLVREGIAALLNQHPDLKVVAGASTADTALLRQVNPHVVLLDLGLGQGDSLRVAEQVKKDFPQSKVIVMDLLPVHEDTKDAVARGRPAALDAVRMTPRTRGNPPHWGRVE